MGYEALAQARLLGQVGKRTACPLPVEVAGCPCAPWFEALTLLRTCGQSVGLIRTS